LLSESVASRRSAPAGALRKNLNVLEAYTTNTSIIKMAFVPCVAVVTLVAAVAFSRGGESAIEPQQKKDHVVGRPATLDVKEAGPFENIVKLSKRADDREIVVARLLKSQPAPSIRATYFRSVLTNPQFRLKTWHLTILEVTNVEGVTRLKVRAKPILTSNAFVHGFLDETYEVHGEELKLLKTEPIVDPAAAPKRFIMSGK
jgi:hypothetical protein